MNPSWWPGMSTSHWSDGRSRRRVRSGPAHRRTVRPGSGRTRRRRRRPDAAAPRALPYRSASPRSSRGALAPGSGLLQRPAQVLFTQPQPDRARRPEHGELPEHRGDDTSHRLVGVEDDLPGGSPQISPAGRPRRSSPRAALWDLAGQPGPQHVQLSFAMMPISPSSSRSPTTPGDTPRPRRRRGCCIPRPGSEAGTSPRCRVPAGMPPAPG